MSALPKNFVYLHDVTNEIAYDIKYASDDNLIGRPVRGYLANVCVLTSTLADKLITIQRQLAKDKLALYLYETYRPTQASEDISQWMIQVNDQKNKADYYPNIDKADFNDLGYIMPTSAHSRGSTVDLTLVDSDTLEPLDMGTRFDFMDPLSHPACQLVSDTAFGNRQLLRRIMYQHGFIGIETEWWHFTLLNEPYSDTYFNFPVV